MISLKKQLKKSNRGIILAFILIIGVVIYTAVDNHNFKTEKPEIEQVIADFVTEMGDFNVTPDELAGKSELSDEDIAAYEEEWNDFVNKYWVYRKQNSGSMYWFCHMTDFRELHSSQLKNLNGEYIKSCTMEARNIRVSKAGPNCATASFELYAVVESTPNAEVITPVYNESIGWYAEDEEGDINKYKLEGDYTLTLERTADGWKIYNSDGYISYYSKLDN